MAFKKHAKEAILKQIVEQIVEQMEKQDGIITQAEAMDIVRPHCIFDIHKIQERAIREKANSLIAQFKKNKKEAMP